MTQIEKHESPLPDGRRIVYDYDLMRIVVYNPDGTICQDRNGKPMALVMPAAWDAQVAHVQGREVKP